MARLKKPILWLAFLMISFLEAQADCSTQIGPGLKTYAAPLNESTCVPSGSGWALMLCEPQGSGEAFRFIRRCTEADLRKSREADLRRSKADKQKVAVPASPAPTQKGLRINEPPAPCIGLNCASKQAGTAACEKLKMRLQARTDYFFKRCTGRYFTQREINLYNREKAWCENERNEWAVVYGEFGKTCPQYAGKTFKRGNKGVLID